MQPAAQAELLEHIREHLTYPATKKQLVEECDNMSDVPEATRKWFRDNLPDRTYNSAEDVYHALNLPHAH